jgi:hypothetical protein
MHILNAFLKSPSAITPFASVLIGALVIFAGTASAVSPYIADANTVILDHLDGGTVGGFLAYQNNTGPCGPAAAAASPNLSFQTSQPGLNGALRLCNPTAAQPAASYIRYNGEVLSQPNGTLEFWVLFNEYGTGLALVDQGPYFGACSGWTYGMGIGADGTLAAGAWNAFNLTSGTNTVPLGRWTHLAVTWGSAGAKLYIDARLVGSDSNTGRPAPGFGGNLMMRLGTHIAGGCVMVDEIRVSNIQRTTFNVPTPAAVGNLQTYAGFTIQGAAGAPCRVDYRSSFGDTNTWLVLSNFTLPTSSYFFVDPTVPASTGQRFYKATLNP